MSDTSTATILMQAPAGETPLAYSWPLGGLEGPAVEDFAGGITLREPQTPPRFFRCDLDLTGTAPKDWPTGPGLCADVGAGFTLMWVQPRVWLAEGASDADPAALTVPDVRVTEMSHQYARIDLIGPAARDVLAGLCPLDPADWQGEGTRAFRTLMDDVPALILCRDGSTLADFSLITDRSIADLIWKRCVRLSTLVAPPDAG